jgi:hypothetical protein
VSDLATARRFALSLPEATEEPHFEMSSFRVRGKIFATVPPDRAYLNVFVDELEIAASAAQNPAVYEPLRWGREVRGLRVRLASAPDTRVMQLLEEAWRRKAPKRVVAEYDLSQRTAAPRSEGPSRG